MKGIVDPQTRTVACINHCVGEGVSADHHTIFSAKSVVYRPCQTKQRIYESSLIIGPLVKRACHLEKISFLDKEGTLEDFGLVGSGAILASNVLYFS